jgi:ComF family protein
VGAYDGVLRTVLHALKYDGRRSIGPRMSALMRQAGADVLDGADVVVPVPLHRRREWSRGFNQADDLARGLGLAVVPLLSRVVFTRAQVELPASQRHKNVRRAFALRSSARRSSAPLEGATLVLVDDVMTTGATLEACARVLLAAGAREVRALTAARAVSRPR